MEFKYIENSENIFKDKHYLKSRDLSIIEFNIRLFDIIALPSTPFMERINFLSIINSNLEEFISVRLPRVKSNEINLILHTIEELYYKMGMVLSAIANHMNLAIETDDKIYKKIFNKDIKYIYAGESDNEVRLEINDLLFMKDNNTSFTILYSGNDDDIFNNESNLEYIIHVPKSILILDAYKDLLTKVLGTNTELYYQKNNIKPIVIDYYNELQQKDILIRNPYESYDNVCEFIEQMCNHPDIQAIFITLYRTAQNSKIVESLIRAKRNNKHVCVFIEPTARDNEKSNIDNINRLKQEGIHVRCNYFNYKVHGKIFCAIDKYFNKFVHIGTGNYNEVTGKFYTDFHLMTSNEKITIEVLQILLSIFEKTIYKPSHFESLSLFSSPLSFRKQIYSLIDSEKMKGEYGRIWIKCNNMCDCSVIDKLYSAAEAGVQIYIICRTGCSIYPHENIHVRSKVGQYLEHDRFYIFGDKVYISSADLLLRNISKRVEILCEIIDEDNKSKIEKCFSEIWTSENIHELQFDGKWELIN